jgi:MFS family permease
MCGAIFFGTMADKYNSFISILSSNEYIYRYGRRSVMSASFILMTLAGFLCTFGPQSNFGVWPSYIIFVIARFLLACSTRGISESGFVLGSEMGMLYLYLNLYCFFFDRILVEPDKRLMVGMIMDYFFTFGEFFLVLMAYIFRTWRILTLTITLFTIPFCFFYL